MIKSKILTGCATGENSITPNDFPFQFKRVQFHINVCFSMAIDKAQVQTLIIAHCEIDLLDIVTAVFLTRTIIVGSIF